MQQDDPEKAEEVKILCEIRLQIENQIAKRRGMPSDKEQAAAAAAAATAATRPKASTAAVAAAADSSKPSPNAPSTSASAGTTRPTAASGPSGSRSSGSSAQTQQPVVLNTLRDPSHYEELNVIGNGEIRSALVS